MPRAPSNHRADRKVSAQRYQVSVEVSPRSRKRLKMETLWVERKLRHVDNLAYSYTHLMHDNPAQKQPRRDMRKTALYGSRT